MINDKELLQQLWEYMEKNPMSYEEIAKELQISRPTAYNMLQKKRKPWVKTMLKVKSFLDSKTL